MAATRTLPAAVLAKTVRAGTIASIIGNAIVTPMPRRTARRDMCFLVMNIGVSLPSFRCRFHRGDAPHAEGGAIGDA